MSASTDVQTININELKVNPDDPRYERNEEFIEDLKESIRREGLLQPIILNEDLTIVDGHYRVMALRELGIEELQYNPLTGYAAPVREEAYDRGIDSMAANVLRDEATQVERAKFANQAIKERVLPLVENDSSVLDILRDAGSEWDHSDEALQELERILSAAGFTSDGDPNPDQAITYLLNYTESQDDVLEAWDRGDIGREVVGALRRIDDDDVREELLERYVADEYSLRDVRTASKVIRGDEQLREAIIQNKMSVEEAEETYETIRELRAEGEEVTRETISAWIDRADRGETIESRIHERKRERILSGKASSVTEVSEDEEFYNLQQDIDEVLNRAIRIRADVETWGPQTVLLAGSQDWEEAKDQLEEISRHLREASEYISELAGRSPQNVVEAIEDDGDIIDVNYTIEDSN